MNNVRIIEGKVYANSPNPLEVYVMECINEAIDRLKDHVLVEEDPLKYVIRTILGLDQPHDPEWQPYARFAKDNLADTETALKFIGEYYTGFKEAVEEMVDNFGKKYYEHIFTKGFDLVRLTSIVYNHVVDQIAHDLEMLDE